MWNAGAAMTGGERKPCKYELVWYSCYDLQQRIYHYYEDVVHRRRTEERERNKGGNRFLFLFTPEQASKQYCKKKLFFSFFLPPLLFFSEKKSKKNPRTTTSKQGEKKDMTFINEIARIDVAEVFFKCNHELCDIIIERGGRRLRHMGRYIITAVNI